MIGKVEKNCIHVWRRRAPIKNTLKSWLARIYGRLPNDWQNLEEDQQQEFKVDQDSIRRVTSVES